MCSSDLPSLSLAVRGPPAADMRPRAETSGCDLIETESVRASAHGVEPVMHVRAEFLTQFEISESPQVVPVFLWDHQFRSVLKQKKYIAPLTERCE